MKITQQDYETLKRFTAPLLTTERKRQYTEAGLSEKRFLFDALYQSKIKIGNGAGIHGDVNLYAYCNDTHIETALRKIANGV